MSGTERNVEFLEILANLWIIFYYDNFYSIKNKENTSVNFNKLLLWFKNYWEYDRDVKIIFQLYVIAYRIKNYQ